MLKRLFAIALIALVTAAGSVSAEETERYGKQKVVYHINYDGQSGTSYKSALGNIQNHINAVGAENLDLKVVLHGAGVGILKAAKTDDTLQTRIGGLKSQNVSFHVCNNTLVNNKIDYNTDLFDTWEDDIVPSGVAELARLQGMGYTYIKP